MTDQYGTLTTDAVLEYDGKHFVIGSDDIYLFGGHPGSIQSISDQKVRRAFFNRVNPINDNTRNLFTLRYASRDEIWVCFPTVNSVRGEADEAYIWNYRTGSWTIRTLNSVIRGDVGPIPGGGIPSAIITLDGDSGTNDITKVGDQEVQTIEVADTASVGHATTARTETQTFRSLRSVGGVTRDAITTDSNELAEIAIGTDVFAGPDPTMQQVTFTDPATSFTFDRSILFGGARLTGSITDVTDPASEPVSIAVAADQIFGSSTRLQESGTGDQDPVFNTGVRITSQVVPQSFDAITGSSVANPTGTAGVTVSAPNFNNPVSDVNPGPTSVATADGGSFSFSGSSANNAATGVASRFAGTNESNGTVSATIAATTREVNTQVLGPPSEPTGLPVGFIIGLNNLPGDQAGVNAVNGFFVNGAGSNVERAARATSALTGEYENTARNENGFGQESNPADLARIQNTFYIGTWSGTGFGADPITNPGFRTIAENGGNPTYDVTLGGITYTVTCATRRVADGSNNRDSTYTNSVIWGEIGFRTTYWQVFIQQSAPFTGAGASAGNGLAQLVNAGPRFVRRGIDFAASAGAWYVPGYVTGGVTITDQRQLTSATNNTNGEITLNWGGTSTTIPAGGSVGAQTLVDSNVNGFSWTGTAAGIEFTNNSGFSIANFNPDSIGDQGTLANGAARSFATRDTNWTGNTETITVSNTNADGNIVFTSNSDTRSPFSIAAGASRSNILNHDRVWSFTGTNNLNVEHTLITAERFEGMPIDNFMFDVVNESSDARGQVLDPVPPFSSGESITRRVDGNVQSNYEWNFRGDVQTGGSITADGTSLTSAAFFTALETAINSGNVEGIDNWRSSNNGLTLTSMIPGMRTVNAFQFTTFTATGAPLSGADLGPHSNMVTTITDNLGEELFTVTRTDLGAGADPRYQYVVSTSRDTGFADSDIVRQVQFRSGNQIFSPPDEIISPTENNGFTFSSNSDSWTVRAGPAATYIPVTRSTFGASGNSYNANDVTVTEVQTTGGITRNGNTLGTVTQEGVTVTVSDSSTPGVTQRTFRFQNSNAYSITPSVVGITRDSLGPNGDITYGPIAGINQHWAWSSDEVTGTGSGSTTIGSVVTTDVEGVTVVSTNTSTAMTTTTITGVREQAVILPASRGNSISDPETATFNPTAEFQFIDFPGRDGTNSNTLRAYRVFANTRGAAGARIFSSWGPSRQRYSQGGEWTNGGAESGVVTPGALFSASNIPNPSLGFQAFSGSSQGQTRRNIQGIRPAGGSANQPAAAVSSRGANPGATWSGGINSGSFNGQVLVYMSAGIRPLDLRIVLMSTITADQTTIVPRNPRESYTITNPHPFPVIFTRSGVQTQVAAGQTVTLTNVSGEGVSWAISTPTTTQYQYTLTNNNIRPIDINSGSFGTVMDLANGEFRTSSFSTTRGFNANITREFLGSIGADPIDVTRTVNAMGSGNVGETQLPVTYNFTNPGIADFNISIPLAEDAVDDMMPTNVMVEETIVAALRADSTFNDYYTVRDHNDDPAIAAGRFDIVARALPGATFRNQADDADLTFPTAPSVFSATIDQQFGGRASLTSVPVPGQDVDDAPVVVTIATGRTVFNPETGMNDLPVTFDTHVVMLSGSYPADEAGDNRLNEQFRQVFRSTAFADPNDATRTWDIRSGDTLNPSMIDLESRLTADHFTTVTATNPALAQFFQFDTTRDGVGMGTGTTYPVLQITPPTSEMAEAFFITLDPPTGVTTRLSNNQIAEVIRSQFSFDGWSIQTDAATTRTGTGVTGNRIKFVKTDAEPVTGGWSIAVANYGTTGTTLSGAVEPDDGTDIGRLNTADFTRVNVGMQDNFDFRGQIELRSEPTRIMVRISNPDFEGGVQFIPFTFGNDRTYNPTDQSGNKGTRVSAASMAVAIQSGITNANRRVQTSLNGSTLSIIPSQFSELAQFVLGITINDSAEGVAEWNRFVMENPTQLDPSLMIGTVGISNGGIASHFEPAIVVDNNYTQFSTTTTRMPNGTETFTAADLTETSDINTVFDPLRPWPTSQVNLNREFPIFATASLITSGENVGQLSQHFRGADLGFLYLDQQYESFVERIELAMTPEFDTEQLQSLALWGDGGSLATFGEDLNQATLTVKMYGTNASGQTLGVYNNNMQNTVSNDFIVGEDYKIDMRIHGRFLNYLITDYMVTDDNARVPNEANSVIDRNLGIPRGISWNLSGMQADIFKGGRR